jgi:YD repeat-containing protein
MQDKDCYSIRSYDVMGRQIRTSDAAGITTFAYNSFSSITNETVTGQNAKSLERHLDGYGRNVGYSLDGQRKQTLAYDPATGRVAGMDGFVWQYMPGTDLKQSLTYPNGTVAEWVYEPQRDLLTLVSNGVFSAYAYENDATGRRVSKNTERYGYNNRGELISATNEVDATSYAYTFDNIGNRIVADELGTNTAYTANTLNQYTSIEHDEETFIPEFDDDGNQTLVKTAPESGTSHTMRKTVL